jgi:hypothetical protein
VVRSHGLRVVVRGPLVPAPLWWLPLGVVAVSVWPLLVATRRLQDEAEGLRGALAGLREVRAGVAVVRDESAALRRTLEKGTQG